MSPDNPEGRFNLSLIHLTRGEYDKGWSHYRWRTDTRRKAGDRVPVPPLRQPRWGGEPLAGKTILLMPEQGFGDTIQFVRYAKLARERGARVFLAVHKPLHRLMLNCPLVDKVFLDGDPLPQYDYWAFPLDLPEYLGTEAGFTICSYIHPAKDLVVLWAARLEQLFGGHRVRPRIGLVWSGRPGHARDAQRSATPAVFAPLVLDERIDWVVIQQGEGFPQAYKFGERLVHNVGRGVTDLADTAAILSNLDLLISIDSAPVHLAGALGVPCWTMLDFAPDWRWLRAGDTTHWYQPNFRLFRQPAPGDWGSVVEALAMVDRG
ncbi:glycosyltransferase, partial [bacterium]|nr:glycosyltransferase [bacterium]